MESGGLTIRVDNLENTVRTLEFQDKLLEERIEGRMAIGEHTNIFLDVVFIVLSIVLWIITMQGWRNSKDIEKERKQIRDLHENDRKEITQYKDDLQKDRELFQNQYSNLIENTVKEFDINRKKIEEGYRVMEEQYEKIINDIKGVSEYYLELVAISHEPDLGERVFEYERILRNSDKYHLSEEEKGRLYYYLSITLYQLATKTPDAKNKIVFDWTRKASKYISNAITLGSKKGLYYYEKGKIELEKYRLEILQNKDFADFAEKIYEIEEFFEIAFKTTDIEFYMFEEMLMLLYDISEKLAQTQSDKRVLYDVMISWFERAKSFDRKAFAEEELEELQNEIAAKIKEQNLKLNN